MNAKGRRKHRRAKERAFVRELGKLSGALDDAIGKTEELAAFLRGDAADVVIGPASGGELELLRPGA